MKYQIPDEKAPGFLKRDNARMKWVSLSEAAKKDKSLLGEASEAMLDWLLLYVTEPADPKEAREALLEISEAEYDEMTDAIFGLGEPEKKASASSSAGQEDKEKDPQSG